ncbi:SH3 and multiple ankyrin repeat domains protein 3 [Schistocerca serialis cubense]|uniref:SH3 and multiple ankyrin repeat domains protein 3 n=1 Tax=Schistocerca serialis cubense TaxID=2023355 RepID=UPI00214F23F1|nr:SH3 and multiple ankyrin repeat domains protein 3 [Schistocerca serialis cubense]
MRRLGLQSSVIQDGGPSTPAGTRGPAAYRLVARLNSLHNSDVASPQAVSFRLYSGGRLPSIGNCAQVNAPPQRDALCEAVMEDGGSACGGGSAGGGACSPVPLAAAVPVAVALPAPTASPPPVPVAPVPGGGAGPGGGPAAAQQQQQAADEGYLLVRVHVPELNVQKCLQFPRDQLVWDVKQQCLAALPKVATWFRELKESFNYGLFCPPVNGKAGKFLDEERRLADYPFNGPVGYLELKYKRRVYKMLNLDEKQLKALHTRANLRRLLDYVANGQVEKITKMCSKGLDPNFHCPETGETPLTLATGIKKPAKVLIALVNGGALLDYRTRDGSTAMHRAVERNSLEAVTTLLELGASPNYRDAKGLTPLYLAVTCRTDPLLCEGLLHDRAIIGAQDLQGWQEVHQACRNGLVQHLEHLLFYGADMNARNASGNTPLHVCAVNSQESCARLLLFRGCDRDALNYANQTPYQVAVIAGNLELAEVIQNHRPENVVPFREPPRYNPRRRTGAGAGGGGGMQHQHQHHHLHHHPHHHSSISRVPADPLNLELPPSPSPSNRSLPPYSSASSSLSETSSGSTQPSAEDSASYVTDKSLGDTSDIISDSSGVGTANSDTTNNSVILPGTAVVCLENYSSSLPGHLRISQGDILEVTGSTDCGLLEGTLRGQGTGLFPAHCVQEVRLRQGVVPPPILPQPPPCLTRPTPPRVQGRRESVHKHFATAPRLKKQLPAEPRTVVLHRAKKGFGFVLRGAKATSPLMELQPSDRCPALQYLDDVDRGGVADMAGLRKGDYLLAINGEDVSAASHEHVVDLIRRSGDLVSMTVVSLGAAYGVPNSKSSTLIPGSGSSSHHRQYATLPRKMTNSGTIGRSPAPLPPRRDPKTTLSVGRARARSMVAGLEGGGEKEDIDDIDGTGLASGGGTAKSSSAESIHQHSTGSNSTPVPPRTASIRARPTSSRITAAELEELFQRQQGSGASSEVMTSHFQVPTPGGVSQPSSPARTPRVYASVAEMKRSKGKTSSRVRFFNGGSDLHRDFHSTPDLARNSALINGSVPVDNRVPKGHRSQEDVAALMMLGGGLVTGRPPLPPPTHPPPPPPIGQLVKVDISRGTQKPASSVLTVGSEYANMSASNIKPDTATPRSSSGTSSDSGSGSIMSSFRPANSAKLYASPEDVKTVGYRSRSLPAHSARPQVRKSHSLRSAASSFKPPSQMTTVQTAVNNTNPYSTTNNNANPYAQPIRASRSHSTAGSKESTKGKSKTKTIPTSSSAANLSAATGSGGGSSSSSSGPPPIPEPDYSLSESEPDVDDESDKDLEEKATVKVETSGNSNASSGSSSSSTLPHSFSVEEIQKVRTQLKSSKSYPNDFLMLNPNSGGGGGESGGSGGGGEEGGGDNGGGSNGGGEDGDNSSSGVSSDQEVPVGPPCGFDDGRSSEGSGSSTGEDRSVQSETTAKQQNPTVNRQRVVITGGGMLTRNAVSLAQLPPPLEGEGEGDGELVVPPPPEFLGGIGNGNNGATTEEVLAPPPQFSDNRLVTRVRIVGAVPKPGASAASARLHSQ